MKKRTLRKIGKYGFLAEPYMRLSEKAALKLVEEEGVPSFERVAASAMAKSSLPGEAWEPVRRVLARRGRKWLPVRLRFNGWTAAAAAAIAIVLFLAFTPPGRALAEMTVRAIERVYEYVLPAKHSPKPTSEPDLPAFLTLEPTTVPETQAPTQEPTPEPTPTARPTPVPTAEPTPEPTLEPEHTCGAEGCTDGIVNGEYCCMLNGGVHICEANFPDPVFRSFVAAHFDDGDGVLSDRELTSARVLELNGMGIKTLKGVEFFEKLESLYCSDNGLTELDLRYNLRLDRLLCANNRLSSVRLENCRRLTNADLHGNLLSSIAVTNCRSLDDLDVSDNRLTFLTLTGLNKLAMLSCGHNPLTSLILTDTGSIWSLEAESCRLMELDLANNRIIMRLDLSNNRLSRLVLPPQRYITYLNVSGNRLRTLELGFLGNGTTVLISPQQSDELAVSVNGSFFELSLAEYLGGLQERVTKVYGLSESGEWIEGAYHVRKGLARFDFLPKAFKYLYDTGAGLMEVSFSVIPPAM